MKICLHLIILHR